MERHLVKINFVHAILFLLLVIFVWNLVGTEELTTPITRSQALKNLYAEAKQLGVEIRFGNEANAFLDHAAHMEGVPPESMHAVTLGNDLIFVRDTHVNNVRVLREELLHTQQQIPGFEISKTSQTNAELQVREQMISRSYEWGITNEEVQEIQNEINIIKMLGGY